MFRSGIAFALLLGLSAAAPAQADLRSEELVGGFVRSVDSSPDWAATAGLVRSDGADTIVEGLVFSRQAPDLRIEVARLRLRDLAARPGGGFSAGEVEIGGAVLTAPHLQAAVPGALARDLSLPRLPVPNFDPRQMLSFSAALYSALTDAEAGELTVPEVTVAQQVPGEAGSTTSTALYRNFRLLDMTGGVIARSEVGPIAITPDEAADSRIEIARAEVERADFGTFAHVLNEAEYTGGAGDGTWRPAIALIRYSGVTGAGPQNATFRLDELTIENVEARQPPRPFVSRLESLPESTAGNPAETRLALETMSDFLAAFRVGAVRLTGMSAAAPPENASMSLAGISLSGWSGMGLDSFALTDFRAASPDGAAALGSMEFAGLTFPDLTAFLDLIGLELDEAAAPVRDAAIRKALYGLPKLSRFAIGDVSAGQAGAAPVTLKSLTLDLDRYIGPFPAEAALSIQDLVVPGPLLTLDPRAAEIFNGLGFTDLVLGITAGETWDEAAGRVDARFGVAVRDAGELALTYTYAGVTEDWLISAIAVAGLSPGESDTEAVLTVLDGLGLEAGTLRVTDRSLLDRAFAYAAKRQGLTIEGSAYREQMRGALPFLLSAALNADLSRLLITPLQAFLAGGQTLVVEARPAAPVPLPALNEAIEGAPLTLPSLLNLTIRSEPAAAP